MARIRKRGRVYQAYFYNREGEREWASTHTGNKRTAQLIADRLERAAHDPNPEPESTTSLGEALKLLLKDRLEQAKAGKRSLGTLKMYRQKAGQLLLFFEVERNAAGEIVKDAEGKPVCVPFPLAKLTAALVDEYISCRRADGVKEHTIAKELVTLRAALKLCKRRGLWRGDLAAIMPDRFSPEYEPRERFLTPADLRKLLGELPGEHGARACLCIATSANDSESGRAEAEDLEAAAVTIRGSKTDDRWRVVPIVTAWQLELIDYVRRNTPASGRLFASGSNSFYHALRRACVDAEIERCSSNDLRRTFAHWMRAAGVSLELLAPAMGHADTKMLERVYGKPTPAELADLMVRSMGGTPVTQDRAHSADSADQAQSAQPAKSPENGAGEGNRTPKGLLPEDFESSLAQLPSPRAYKRKPSRARSTDTPVTQADVIALPRRRRA